MSADTAEQARHTPDLEEQIDAIILSIIGDVAMGKDARFIFNRTKARINMIRGLDRDAIQRAEGEGRG